MGDIIRKTAAADDIVSDVRTTLTAAQARGGVWQTLAEEHLSNALSVIDLVVKRRDAAQTALVPLKASVDAFDETADALLGRISDAIWNDVGRPAHDPVFALLFPGGLTYYVDGPDDEQPLRMDLLAEMLEANLHPRLDPGQARDYAGQIRAVATDYAAAVAAAQVPRAQVEMFGRMYTAVARNAQINLANLKRHYKISGFNEAAIHAVIPDRPTAKKPAPSVPPAPPTGETGSAA